MPNQRFATAPSLLAASFVLALLGTLEAQAAVFFVDANAPDVLATDGVCSLREAITNANDDAATWPDCPPGTGDDEILLSSGVFQAMDSLFIESGSVELVGLGADQSVLGFAPTSPFSGIGVVVAAGASLYVEAIAIRNAQGCGLSNFGITNVHRAVISETSLIPCKRWCGFTFGGAICGFGSTEITESAITDNDVGLLGNFTVRNSTIAHNGIVTSLASGSISHSTIADNEIGHGSSSGALTLEASIWARNGPRCAPFISLGHNIEDDGTCVLTAETDLPNTDPLLGSLSSTAVPFIPLLPGSPAIDAIPTGDCTWDDDADPMTPEVPLLADQRGIARPQGHACDIGAFERIICGMGPELALLIPVLAWARVRRRR